MDPFAFGRRTVYGEIGDMMKRHLIISGTGRAGTTFLVQLLTKLGLDTGFPDAQSEIYPNCHAGMEWDLAHPDAPYVVKNPTLCEHLEQVLQSRKVVIDHAILPVRDLYSVAESRRDVRRRSEKRLRGVGGLWNTSNPKGQEPVPAQLLYNFIHTLAKHDIPVTLLHFPKLVREPDYLYKKLQPLLSEIGYDAFLPAFQAVSRPELVHDFVASPASLPQRRIGYI